MGKTYQEGKGTPLTGIYQSWIGEGFSKIDLSRAVSIRLRGFKALNQEQESKQEITTNVYCGEEACWSEVEDEENKTEKNKSRDRLSLAMRKGIEPTSIKHAKKRVNRSTR